MSAPPNRCFKCGEKVPRDELVVAGRREHQPAPLCSKCRRAPSGEDTSKPGDHGIVRRLP